MKLCLGCMSEYPDELSICPHCGYAEGTSPDEIFHLTPGTVLNSKYTLGRVLGYGGFGITYIAWDNSLERKVAIKEYFPMSISSRSPRGTEVIPYGGDAGVTYSDGLRRFFEEAKRLARFNEIPGIVDIYETFGANSTGYIVMQCLDGCTVKDLIRQKPMSYDEARLIMTDVLSTLSVVHNEGIIHRDISPDNIFITTDNKIKLLDFGAAKFYTGLNASNLSVILKPGYAPPEQYATNGRQGPWTDVYSAAATMHKMITGKSVTDAVGRMSRDTLRTPAELGISLPDKANKGIKKALSLRSEKRIQTADEFLSYLIPGSNTNANKSAGTSDSAAGRRNVKLPTEDKSTTSDSPKRVRTITRQTRDSTFQSSRSPKAETTANKDNTLSKSSNTKVIVIASVAAVLILLFIIAVAGLKSGVSTVNPDLKNLAYSLNEDNSDLTDIKYSQIEENGVGLNRMYMCQTIDKDVLGTDKTHIYLSFHKKNDECEVIVMHDGKVVTPGEDAVYDIEIEDEGTIVVRSLVKSFFGYLKTSSEYSIPYSRALFAKLADICYMTNGDIDFISVPSFDPNITEYSVSLPNTTSEILISPVIDDENTMLEITAAGYDETKGSIAVTPTTEAQIIEVKIKASGLENDKEPREYIVNFTVAPLEPVVEPKEETEPEPKQKPDNNKKKDQPKTTTPSNPAPATPPVKTPDPQPEPKPEPKLEPKPEQQTEPSPNTPGAGAPGAGGPGAGGPGADGPIVGGGR